MNIAIFSGEVSGDLIGGALARELQRLRPEASLWGIGGHAMREAGVELAADSAEWGAISITEAIVKAPMLLMRMAPKLRRMLRTRRPDVLVLIDFGAFNVRAARFAKRLGLKVLYYFPPGSWRKSGAAGAEIARLADVLAVPFEWTLERYRQLGANAVYVGHPLLERVNATLSRAAFADHFGMDPAKPIIGLLPGSRKHEIAHLMPTLLDAARLIYQRDREAQFVIGVAPSLSIETMAEYLAENTELAARLSEFWYEFVHEAETRVRKQIARTANSLSPQGQRKLVTVGGLVVPEETLHTEMDARRRAEKRRSNPVAPPTVLVKGLIYDVMAHCDVLLTCSGTATLEAAVLGTPMVILYRGSKVMELEYRLRGIKKKILHIGLPNILAERRIVPELIQGEATPEAIAEQAMQMLNDPEVRHRVKQDLAGVRELLGEPGASEKTAELVLNLAESGR